MNLRSDFAPPFIGHVTGMSRLCALIDKLRFCVRKTSAKESRSFLPLLIQRFDREKSFWIQFKNERRTEFLQAVRRHINDRINTIYQFIKSFLDNKMFILEEYGAF